MGEKGEGNGDRVVKGYQKLDNFTIGTVGKVNRMLVFIATGFKYKCKLLHSCKILLRTQLKYCAYVWSLYRMKLILVTECTWLTLAVGELRLMILPSLSLDM